MVTRLIEYLGWALWGFFKLLLIAVIIRICLPFFGFDGDVPVLDPLINFFADGLKGVAMTIHSFNVLGR